MNKTSEKSFLPLDILSFQDESKAVVDFISDYYKNIEKYPVQSIVDPGYLSSKLPDSAPCTPDSLEDVLNDVNQHILPGLTHWQSPNFFAYYQASSSTAGFLGEMLCSAFNVVGFNWISSPAATELESVVVDWMGKMLKLPSSFLFSGTGGGVIHGTTCEAVVCTLAAARDKALKELDSNWANITKFVVYASDQTHFTFQKAAKLVGIPPSNFRFLQTSFATEFAMSPEVLRSAIKDDIRSGLVPLYICATVGTTACGAVDPIADLGKIANEYKLWLHIDAAHAGNACICPEFRHFLDGVELASSLSMNPHKWFLTNMDCCCLWLKEPRFLIDSLSSNPEYLENNASKSNVVVDYKDWQVTLSRRFRALKLWIVIRRIGVENLMHHIRSDVNLAKQFEALIKEDDRFEIVVPRRIALVLFRLKPEQGLDGSELNRKLLDAINYSGRAFMTQGTVSGIYAIRCVVGATLTEERHMNDLWSLIQEKAQLVLFQCSQ
ncbi:Tyrosine/DOPA decarboxylase 2 [Hibiscus syriacus]|uniref:Tyrosine/DOPA decarboxylase 2 n=1 Tax=Hibiscus syriacus TaxID=106335 RepID=A0A6A2XW13_HIBSY|nr:tyrosine decarboxylase 1-like [Hibiscus syriacus]KAE8679768.1 Tyrosine/DOPA decarboxylase 2 [Hibiscus syriacus]